MIDIESIYKRTEKLINDSSTDQLMADLIDCGLGDSEYEGSSLNIAIVDTLSFRYEIKTNIDRYELSWASAKNNVSNSEHMKVPSTYSPLAA